MQAPSKTDICPQPAAAIWVSEAVPNLEERYAAALATSSTSLRLRARISDDTLGALAVLIVHLPAESCGTDPKRSYGANSHSDVGSGKNPVSYFSPMGPSPDTRAVPSLPRMHWITRLPHFPGVEAVWLLPFLY